MQGEKPRLRRRSQAKPLFPVSTNRYNREYPTREERPMKALITGASAGIGRDMARILSAQGHELILTARSQENLASLQEELPTHTESIPLDLSEPKAAGELYERVRSQKIDILIN